MDTLSRWREPVAVTLLVVSALRLLLSIVGVPLYAAERYRSFPLAALAEGSYAADPLLVAAVAGVAIWCGRPTPTPHARTIQTLAFLAGAALLVLSLVFAAVGLASTVDLGWLDFFDTLTRLAVPALAVVGLGVVRFTDAQPVDQRPAVGPETAGAATGPTAGLPARPAIPDPQYQPGWSTEQASGAAWHTAGDAASGAPAAGWGTGESGWNPIPRSGPGQPPTGDDQPR